MKIINADFIVGYTAQEKLTSHDGFLIATPGLNNTKKGNKLGQNYNTLQAVFEN